MAVNTTWSSPATAGGSGGTDLSTGDTVSETIWDRVQSNAYRLGGTDGNAKTGKYQIGSTQAFSNAAMTQGLTINQDANDDEILALKSSDVAHGVTGVTETDTYAAFAKAVATDGGLKITGVTETFIGIYPTAIATSGDTTKGTGGVAACYIDARKKTGTSTTVFGANENLWGVADAGSLRAVLDKEGDLHLDATSNQNVWDDYDDLALLEAFRVTTANPTNYRRLFAQDVDAHARILQETGVLTLNDDGHHFVSLKGLFGLLIDAVRQTNARLGDRLLALETHPLLATQGGS